MPRTMLKTAFSFTILCTSIILYTAQPTIAATSAPTTTKPANGLLSGSVLSATLKTPITRTAADPRNDLDSSMGSLDVRRDAREPSFAQVTNLYYQNQLYSSLSKLLAFEDLSYNASATVNILLGDLFTQYGLTREADAAISRLLANDVTAHNRNPAWLRFAKLLYQTKQDSLALNFLSKPPALLTPTQESERVLMLANVLIRQNRADEAIKLLENFQTPSIFYSKLLKYNLALAYLNLDDAYPESRKAKEDDIFDLRNNKYAFKSLQLLENLRPVKVDTHQNKNKGKKNRDKPLLTATIEDATEEEMLNLNDKISLSTAFLHLSLGQPEQARLVLRDVRIDSPYSNQALLTSAHVYWQLRDFKKSLTFANELSTRSAEDPIVLEGKLIVGKCLEELKDATAQSYYLGLIDLYKNQLAGLYQLEQNLAQTDLVALFPVTSADPVDIGEPNTAEIANGIKWASLLSNPDIFTTVQYTRQISVLSKIQRDYTARYQKLPHKKLSDDQSKQLQDVKRLLDFTASKIVMAQQINKQNFEQLSTQFLKGRQKKINIFLTESYLGLQRVETQGAQSE